MTVGPRALAVIESVLARFSVLVECEHLAEGQDAFWVALQPDSLLCGFCWEAAQVLAGDAACSSCARPAGDPRRDCVVVANADFRAGGSGQSCRVIAAAAGRGAAC